MSGYAIALTGGIASGKSAVATAFAKLGRTVVDADVAARAVVEPGEPALAEIAARFGTQALHADGRLDRAWLRAHAFADPVARRDLEAITHPRIRERLQADAAQARDAYVLVAIPLLAEGGGRTAYPWLRRICVVDASESMQLARLRARDGCDAALARRMIEAQATRAQRCALADDVVVNDGSEAALVPVVAKLDALYARLAAARP
jgi:dephospho-CoA kinase